MIILIILNRIESGNKSKAKDICNKFSQFKTQPNNNDEEALF